MSFPLDSQSSSWLVCFAKVKLYTVTKLRNDVNWMHWRMLFQRQRWFCVIRIWTVHKSESLQEFIKVNETIFVHVYTFCQVLYGVQWNIWVSVFIKKTTWLLKFLHWNKTWQNMKQNPILNTYIPTASFIILMNDYLGEDSHEKTVSCLAAVNDWWFDSYFLALIPEKMYKSPKCKPLGSLSKPQRRQQEHHQ